MGVSERESVVFFGVVRTWKLDLEDLVGKRA